MNNIIKGIVENIYIRQEAELIRIQRREEGRDTHIIEEDLESSNKILRQAALKMQYNIYITQPKINLADALLHPNELIRQWAEIRIKDKGC